MIEIPPWDKFLFALVLVAIIALAVTQPPGVATAVAVGGVYAELRHIRIIISTIRRRNE